MKTFNNIINNVVVRTVEIGGQNFVVASDVFKLIGLKDTKKAVTRIPKQRKKYESVWTGNRRYVMALVIVDVAIELINNSSKLSSSEKINTVNDFNKHIKRFESFHKESITDDFTLPCCSEFWSEEQARVVEWIGLENMKFSDDIKSPF